MCIEISEGRIAVSAASSNHSFKQSAPFYRAMVPTQTYAGLRPANLAMAEVILAQRDQSRILDAACGGGWDAIAIANGLPGLAKNRSFEVSVSDASAPMLIIARRNFTSANERLGVVIEDVRCATFEDLSKQHDWAAKFDVVLAPNAIGLLPPELHEIDYDRYVYRSLQGLRATMKKGARLLIDNRDWEETLQMNFSRTRRENAHSHERFTSEYHWQLGTQVESAHRATMTIYQEGDPRMLLAEESFVFAGRSKETLRKIFHQAGLTLLHEYAQRRGACDEPFVTYLLTH